MAHYGRGGMVDQSEGKGQKRKRIEAEVDRLWGE